MYTFITCILVRKPNACATKSETELKAALSRTESGVESLRAALGQCWNYSAFRLVQQAEVAHQYKNPVWLPKLSPPPPGPRGHVRRPRLGETIRLASAAHPAFPNVIVWKRKGHLLASRQTEGDLRYNRTGDNALQLHDVTYAAWGKFECLQRCQQNETDDWCLQAEYWVFPKPTAEYPRLFGQWLPAVTVPKYMPFSVTCQLECPCGPDPAQHFIWRYAGVYLA
ncbi:uncharacterized protein LOC129587366 [Paramacrobiotus metropolitanus]|uniref:uncharacterized protein LOC129587366 n=1 Tax=Paramacrobiotus metropolitanus TaxID=2943436 RepID=UPI002445B94A|nr:uncharacterized protein LOC129587366 [Paramacrobiotus metropolitanus]XP_055337054.1 uncharacterized protein LOC129587366 [Paramacrobiotus metropolitanus]